MPTPSRPASANRPNGNACSTSSGIGRRELRLFINGTGYQYHSHIPQLGQLRFIAYGRSGPAHSDSLTFLDNLRIDEGGITTGPTITQERYLHSDHLGSIVAVTDNHW